MRAAGPVRPIAVDGSAAAIRWAVEEARLRGTIAQAVFPTARNGRLAQESREWMMLVVGSDEEAERCVGDAACPVVVVHA